MWSHQLRTFPTPENFDFVEGSPKIRGSCGQLKPTPTTAGLRSLALQVFLGPSCSQVTQSWQDLLDSLCFDVIPVGIRRYCSRLLENTGTLWAFRDYYLLAQLNVIWELFCLFVSWWAPETWGSSPKLFPLSASFSCMVFACAAASPVGCQQSRVLLLFPNLHADTQCLINLIDTRKDFFTILSRSQQTIQELRLCLLWCSWYRRGWKLSAWKWLNERQGVLLAGKDPHHSEQLELLHWCLIWHLLLHRSAVCMNKLESGRGSLPAVCCTSSSSSV